MGKVLALVWESEICKVNMIRVMSKFHYKHNVLFNNRNFLFRYGSKIPYGYLSG